MVAANTKFNIKLLLYTAENTGVLITKKKEAKGNKKKNKTKQYKWKLAFEKPLRIIIKPLIFK